MDIGTAPQFAEILDADGPVRRGWQRYERSLAGRWPQRGPVEKTMLAAGDIIAATLYGDIAYISTGSNVEGDERVAWLWSGTEGHWIPGRDGNQGTPAQRVVRLSGRSAVVVVDPVGLSPRMLDHQVEAKVVQFVGVSNNDFEACLNAEIVPIGGAQAGGGWRATVREKVQASDVVVVEPAQLRSGVEAAYVIAVAAMSGRPLYLTTLPDVVSQWLAPELVQELRQIDLRRVELSARYRDYIGVRLRRQALRFHTVGSTLQFALGVKQTVEPDPSVLVMIPTIRPAFLPQVVRYLNAQTYKNFEVKVVLDRVVLKPEVRAELLGCADFALSIEQNAKDLSVGEIYNKMMGSSNREIAVVWDDDDHYSEDHLLDLVQALVFSGAWLAGKWAEFYHLESTGVTVQRSPDGRYSQSRSIGGPAIAMWRSPVIAAGGFAAAVSGYDQELVRRMFAYGSAYRTHGYGFIASRRNSGHTWAVSDQYFIEQSVRQWPGFSLDCAGFGSELSIDGSERDQ